MLPVCSLVVSITYHVEAYQSLRCFSTSLLHFLCYQVLLQLCSSYDDNFLVLLLHSRCDLHEPCLTSAAVMSTTYLLPYCLLIACYLLCDVIFTLLLCSFVAVVATWSCCLLHLAIVPSSCMFAISLTHPT